MTHGYELNRWQEAAKAAITATTALLRSAAPALSVRDSWPSSGAPNHSVALVGPCGGGGMMTALVTCPMHVSIVALALPLPSADRFARAVFGADEIAYPAKDGTTVSDLAALDTSGLGPGECLPIGLPVSPSGHRRVIKLYAHGVADLDLAQLSVPAAAQALAALAATTPAAA